MTFPMIWRQSLSLLLLITAADRTPCFAKRHGKAPEHVLWQEPGPSRLSNWVWGVGGRARAPRPPFRFVEEDLTGTNPKVTVRDARGAEWTVKWGPEVQSDTFVPRFVHAVGYIAEASYFVPRGHILGVHDLKRAKASVSPNGAFADARFKLHDRALRALEGRNWSWTNNPFLGTRELNGLKTLMLLLSNWDAKDARDQDGGVNTAILTRADRRLGPSLYLVTDWGASLGKWGGFFQREKWNCPAYVEQSQAFVKGVKDGLVEWGFTGKHGRDLTSGIRVEDVRWLLRYVTRIPQEHLRAGLAASGATPDEVECFSAALRARMRQLDSTTHAVSGQDRRYSATARMH